MPVRPEMLTAKHNWNECQKPQKRGQADLPENKGQLHCLPKLIPTAKTFRWCITYPLQTTNGGMLGVMDLMVWSVKPRYVYC